MRESFTFEQVKNYINGCNCELSFTQLDNFHKKLKLFLFLFDY